MNLLLDTHALLWWAHQPWLLPSAAGRAIHDGNNPVFVSAVSAMEIATKVRRRRLGFETDLAENFTAQIEARGFRTLAITCEHAEVAGGFISAHNDPWDRLLAAQARVEGLTLVSNDAAMRGFGVDILW